MEHSVQAQEAGEAFRCFGDLPIPIEAELGRRTLSVAEILNLTVGRVLRLDRSAGENIDLWMGGVLVAYGEIVILEESTGVRITDFAAQD